MLHLTEPKLFWSSFERGSFAIIYDVAHILKGTDHAGFNPAGQFNWQLDMYMRIIYADLQEIYLF